MMDNCSSWDDVFATTVSSFDQYVFEVLYPKEAKSFSPCLLSQDFVGCVFSYLARTEFIK